MTENAGASFPWDAIGGISTVVIALVAAIAVIVALATARAARAAANHTRNATEAELVLRFLQRYSSTEMEEALKGLRMLQDNMQKNLGKEEITTEDIKNSRISGKDQQYRRKVYYYFKDAYQIYEAGYLTKDSLKLLADKNGLKLMPTIIEPMARAATPVGSSETRVDWIGALMRIMDEK